MPEIVRRVRRWWRLADRVVITIVALPLLALLGVIGAGDEHLLRTEHFDAKQVIVTPTGSDGLRITEVVDIDFARNSRHGYQRIIPDDYGDPIELAATSTANADVDVDTASFETRIRIGSPDQTFRGPQRYQLSYTLPDAEISTDQLSLDIIGTDETLTTDRFDIWITGLELDNVDCDRGRWAAEGGCEFRMRDGMLFASIDGLRAGDGITVNADIVGRSDATSPPIQGRPAGWSLRWPLALVLLGVGAAALAVLYLFSRWYGTNRVGGGGATGAAFPDSDAITRRVPDAELAKLAATEFGPPTGMRPWQGALAVNEAIDERSIIAWFSEMIAIGVLDLDVSSAGTASVRRVDGGPAPDADDEVILTALFAHGKEVTFSRYGKGLANAWAGIARQQETHARTSGWWHRDVPTYRLQRSTFRLNWSVISFVTVVYAFLSLVLFRSLVTPLTPLSWLFSFPVVCISVTVVATAFAAFRAFAVIRPARTVIGTAAALRVLGFRKFLEQSEGRHVDEAWDRDTIREYSAWAVALGAATAWADHVELLPAPSEPLRLDWAKALERVVTSVDLDSVTVYRSSSRGDQADPWGAVGRGLKWWVENANSGGSGGSSGSSSSFSSSSSSSGVGSGGGGGSSGSW